MADRTATIRLSVEDDYSQKLDDFKNKVAGSDEAVREMGDATEDATNASDDFADSLDGTSGSLEDTAKKTQASNASFGQLRQGMQVTMGVIRAVGDAFEYAATKGEELGRVDIRRNVDQAKNAMQAFVDVIVTAPTPMGNFLDIMNDAAQSFSQVVIMAGIAQIEYEKWTGRLDEAGAHAKEVELINRSLATSSEEVSHSVETASDAMDKSLAAQGAYTYAQQALAAVQEQRVEKEERIRAAEEAQGAALERVNAMTAALKATQDGWIASTANQVQNALEKAGVTGQKYADALGAIDATFGTSKAKSEEQQVAVDALAKKYADGKISLEDFQAGLKQLELDFLPGAAKAQERLDEALEKNYTKNKNLTTQLKDDVPKAHATAQLSVDAFVESLNKQHATGGAMYNYIVDLNAATGAAEALAAAVKSIPPVPGGSGTGGQGAGTTKPGDSKKGASGLDFTVPAGYPNDSYPIFAQSGERVRIDLPGEGDMGSGGGITIQNLTVVSDNAERMFDEIARVARTRGKSFATLN